MSTPRRLPPNTVPPKSGPPKSGHPNPVPVWSDDAAADRPWRTPAANDSAPAIRRFLVIALVVIVVVSVLWSTGALRPRRDTETFWPAGTTMKVGSFEVSFTEAVAERSYDGEWKLEAYGTVRGLDSETTYAPKGLLAWPDGSVEREIDVSVGDDYGTAVNPGLTSTIKLSQDLPENWRPVDTVCAGFHEQKQGKAKLGDDGKTWVSQITWSCNWVPLVVATR